MQYVNAGPLLNRIFVHWGFAALTKVKNLSQPSNTEATNKHKHFNLPVFIFTPVVSSSSNLCFLL